jgi:hypothetical protein
MANRLDAIKSLRRIQCSSASIRTTWQYRLDAIQSSTCNRVSVSDTNMGRQLQTVRTMWCSRLDARATSSRCGLDMEAFSAILERRLQLIVRTLGQAVWTPSSISIITFCSNIGLGWNWNHWKANKKINNLIAQTAKRNIRTGTQNRPDARQTESDFQQFLRSHKAYE